MAIVHIEKIEQTYNNIKRFEEIIKVIFKYDLQGFIHGFELPTAVQFAAEKLFQRESKEIKSLPLAKRFRLALQELGPTYIKFGQLLSLRNELLPVDIIDELTYLQDHVAPFDYMRAREIIETELDRSIDEMFSNFEEKLVGSASLGQVYRAQLKDGSQVVVKVQRPDIQEEIETDLEILMHLAQFAEKNIAEFKYRKPSRFVEEISESLERELNYKQEESNILRFAQEFKDDESVYVMKCYPEYSTKRVLTMEFIDGIKSGHTRQIDKAGLDRKVIAERGVNCILKQIFENGFFHADPHPGNIFVLSDNLVSFIDFGMVGRLSRKNREMMAEFIAELVNYHPDKAVRILLKITDHPKNLNQGKLERELAELLDRYVSKPLREVSFAQLFYELSELLVRHKMIFPSDFSMMLKAIATVEGVGRKLDPEINLTARLTPYFYRLKLSRFYPKNIMNDMDDTFIRMIELMKDIPDRFQELLSQAVAGDVNLKVEHRGNKAFYIFWNQLVNRLSFTLILAALLISSSIMVLSGVPPLWNDIPLIGLAGFILAGAMSIRLLFSIWKKGMF